MSKTLFYILFVEAEILKIDLNEEVNCDTVKVEGRKNVSLIDQAKTDEMVDKLSTIEKEDLADKYGF